MSHGPNRRQFLQGAAAAAGASALGLLRPSPADAADKAPTSPVSIARCKEYDPDTLLKQLETMVDQLGGIHKLVADKTVAVKVNLTGNPRQKALGLPAGQTYQVHPNMVLAVATLLDQAGAKRIRFVEGTYQTGPAEEYFQGAGWDLKALTALRPAVEFEDTRNLGKGKKYHPVKVPWGGSLFPEYLLNHSYVDCDVYLSLAKLKNHVTAGVTLAMKNNFGVCPTAIYGQHEHNEQTTSNRFAMFHEGKITPAAGVPQEVDPNGPRRTSYRVPRHTVDAVGIRPIDLAILDGIETVSGGEGPWVELKAQKPGLLLMGRNPVCTDAVATAAMGYDPLAKAATGPFPGDNHLALAAGLGLGTNNLEQIEVVGVQLKEAVYPFRWEPQERNT